MLKSRTVADNLVQQFDLRSVYGEDTVTDARKRLSGRTEVSNGRDGVIRIDVDDRDAKRAADLANAYVAQLENLTLRLTVSEAGQRRLFFEKQLLKAKSDLTEAEVALQRFQEKAGLIAPEAQASMTVSIAANLRAQVTAKEVQLSALRAFATKDNPDLVRTGEELATLREQLAKMERDAGKLRGDVLVPVGRAPEVAGEYVQRYRDMKYFETLFQLLAKQYEIARIDEARDAVVVQVLDNAVVPEKKSGPKRAIIVLIVGLAALFLAVPGALIAEGLRNVRAQPEGRAKLAMLRAQLRSR
jgi:capsule polysaccharide export protein KpsE/RkpR